MKYIADTATRLPCALAKTSKNLVAYAYLRTRKVETTNRATASESSEKQCLRLSVLVSEENCLTEDGQTVARDEDRRRLVYGLCHCFGDFGEAVASSF